MTKNSGSPTSIYLLVPAFNEERTIKRLIESILMQDLEDKAVIIKIVIVSSSNDSTDQIIREQEKLHPELELIAIKERKGKMHDLDTGILKLESQQGFRDRDSLLVIMNSDITIRNNRLISKLIEPMIKDTDHSIGLTCGRVISAESRNNGFAGYWNSVFWELIFELNRSSPDNAKVSGEIICLRTEQVKPIDDKILSYAWAEDIFFEWTVRQTHKKVEYVPSAEVYVNGSGSIGEIISWRKRMIVHVNRFALETGYRTFSNSLMMIPRIKTVVKTAVRSPKELIYFTIMLMVELCARILATYEIISNKDGRIYERFDSMKPKE